MTPDEHQRERRAFWDGVCIALCPPPTPFPQMDADALLAERDKRFPAPSAAAPVEPVAKRVELYDAGYDEGYKCGQRDAAAELASLRQKARLWDAVASGKVRLSVAGRAYCTWALGNEMTSLCDTAEEAVEAAIAAGALK